MEQSISRKTVILPPALLQLTLLFLLLLFAFPLMPSLAESPSTAPVDATIQMEQTLLGRINQIRASNSLQPLQLDSRLAEAAHAHVAEAQTRNYMSHTGADGSSYGQRIARSGFQAASVNEAIGWGYNIERQLNWWMNSATHRGMILSAEYTHIGIGYRGNPDQQWGHWWVLNFARPQ